MPDIKPSLPFYSQSPIVDEILTAMKESKQQKPNLPDHICAREAVVAEGGGMLLTMALKQKYDHKLTEDQIIQNREDMRDAAIYAAAMAIRFLETFEIENL